MSELPRIITVMQAGEFLLKQYDLKDRGWKFEISSTKRFVGRCFHGRKTIEFSKYYLHISEDELIDTIRHEIAHALVGPGHGHDNTWKEMAVMVGARPIRCAPPSVKSSARHNYLIHCVKCNRTWKRFRLKEAVKTATHCGVPVVVYRVKHEQ